MSNATRKARRSQVPRDGWKGENRRSVTIPVDISAAAEKVALEKEIQGNVTAYAPNALENVELFPYSAVMECSQAAYSKGWSKGFRLGICVGGAAALLTYAITFATSVLP